MKKYLKYAALALMLFVAACTPEEDTSDPNFDARDKLVGTWSCTENSQVFGKRIFAIGIKKSTNDKTNIIVSNFNQLGNDRNAIIAVSGTTTLTISSQVVDGNIISGFGSCTSTGSTINLSYTVNDGQTNDNVTATCTK